MIDSHLHADGRTGSLSPGNRYRLLNLLGAGGMGSIYRAFDRLTGETVALKRVTTSAMQPVTSTEQRLALAHEFQALAGLRHPHIIAVRDYGFDQRGQPYFSMDLLADARAFVDAGQFLSTSDKLDLILQLLSGLVYIHRRQIVHRDLKPNNVLVSGQRVKVLDFGLAAFAGQILPTSGTLAYMAPEVVRGEPATLAADLYAVGVLAYELLAGWHPFAYAGRDVTQATLHTEVDFTFVDIDPPLTLVLQRLLAKRAEDRYADATAASIALCEAASRALPDETLAVRESFLQTAPLVGRTAELAQLIAALDGARQSMGSAWLISGESGIGKTRLTQELRTQALVAGAFVLRGQANGESNVAYGLWRDLLRPLVLLAQPSDPEAAVLHPLLPDLANLLERPIPAVPLLDPKATQTRLLLTVAELVRRAAAQQPLLFLLEDLHWSDDNSLALLQWINRLLPQLPVLIVGTYRHGERPQLAERLPEMQALRLQRLTLDNVGQLSAAILGAEGRRQHLVDFLQQETEGNTFFLVETIRLLAEESGRLDRIAHMPLPYRVFGGGMAQVVQRRLQRVPPVYQPLLQWAAVGGRQLDLALLRHLAPTTALEAWLTTCANANVLEILDGDLHWQFSHDKLREGILRQLDAEQRRALHAQIGGALEIVYARDLTPYYADLAYHYGEAGQLAHEQRYARRAGEQAAAQFANPKAITYLSRALELTPDDQLAERAALLLARERVYHMQGNREHQSEDLTALEALVQTYADDQMRAEVALQRADYTETIGDYPAAILAAQHTIELAKLARDTQIETLARLRWGVCLWRQGHYAASQLCLQQALPLAQHAGLQAVAAEILGNLGTVCRHQGAYTQARRYYEQMLTTCRALGDRRGEGVVVLNLGVIEENEGNYASARAHYEESLRIRREIGDRRGEGVALNNLGVVADSQGEYTRATACYEAAMRIYVEINNRWGQGYVLNNLAFVFRCQGDYATARRYCEEAITLRQAIGDQDGESEGLAFLGLICHHQGAHDDAWAAAQASVKIARALGARPQLGYALTCLGHTEVALGRLPEAIAAYSEAAQIRQAIGEQARAMEALAGLARVALLEGNLAAAQAHIAPILQHLAQHTLDGTEEPQLVYLTCYKVLQACQDARAAEILHTAYTLLQERATKIEDVTLRHSFLVNVKAHQEIITAYQAM